MDAVTPRQHQVDAARIRELLARHADIELLLRVGEYQKGSDVVADEAIARIDRINAFLRQTADEHPSLEDTRRLMREILS
jgi:type III secretion protein N (ATPase)